MLSLNTIERFLYLVHFSVECDYTVIWFSIGRNKAPILALLNTHMLIRYIQYVPVDSQVHMVHLSSLVAVWHIFLFCCYVINKTVTTI